jgi:hypothetical protein
MRCSKTISRAKIDLVEPLDDAIRAPRTVNHRPRFAPSVAPI